MTKYKIELLEKLSNWLINVQTCMTEDYIPDDYVSISAAKTNPKSGELVWINLHRRRNYIVKVVEEGKLNGIAIAMILDNEISEAVKSVMNTLQTYCEIFFKYSKILESPLHGDELDKICEDFEKEHLTNLKSLNEAVAQLIGKIFNTRISLFDCYFSGSDPFKNFRK